MKKGILVSILLLAYCALLAQGVGYQVIPKNAISVKTDQLQNAKSLIDLNPGYPSMIISKKDYLSTKLSSSNQGANLSASGLTDELNTAQKKLLSQIKQGSYIDVEVNYYQQNSATLVSELREMRFALRFTPEVEAEYLGGYEKLIEYFKEKLSSGTNTSKALESETIVVEFIIDEAGRPTNVTLSTPPKDPEVGAHILDVVRMMPAWQPAQDAAGNSMKQDFVFSAGNLVGC